jgi:hypothetical protein
MRIYPVRRLDPVTEVSLLKQHEKRERQILRAGLVALGLAAFILFLLIARILS